MKGHFWWSAKKDKLKKFFPRSAILTAKLDTGKIVKYNIMCSNGSLDHGAKWDDLVYLGEGRVYSVDGVIQGAGV